VTRTGWSPDSETKLPTPLPEVTSSGAAGLPVGGAGSVAYTRGPVGGLGSAGGAWLATVNPAAGAQAPAMRLVRLTALRAIGLRSAIVSPLRCVKGLGRPGAPGSTGRVGSPALLGDGMHDWQSMPCWRVRPEDPPAGHRRGVCTPRTRHSVARPHEHPGPPSHACRGRDPREPRLHIRLAHLAAVVAVRRTNASSVVCSRPRTSGAPAAVEARRYTVAGGAARRAAWVAERLAADAGVRAGLLVRRPPWPSRPHAHGRHLVRRTEGALR